ncbi:hypothetical protein JDV02_006676 [Purpureocillium takamizusanense]|uniref:Uncharacterized protein n=1 Tax=Purpureocillium takamizusanense TaxID=2060973 RepID=A0A9Q8QJ14_9HYPO|nr:uncharacterized protein JDV02_006676 [Purpureocillium takamizusanense]UNI20605.1 hypothetical protein JDV02_006676 [Purpureocillium takamizusanense]
MRAPSSLGLWLTVLQAAASSHADGSAQRPLSSAAAAAAPIAMAASNPIDKLAVALHQTGRSPPSVRATVTNNNDHPVTVLTYQSPLDPAALALGLLAITPAGASRPLELPVVKMSRQWPPRGDALVSLDAGASASRDLVLEEPKVPADKLGEEATVVLEGKWMAVWPKARSELSDEEIDKSTQYGFSQAYKTDELAIKIG